MNWPTNVCAGFALLLAGCATAPPLKVNDADCRHVLTADGTPLRFCQTDNHVTVDTELPTPPPNQGTRLIDNPEFLAQMIEQMPQNPRVSTKLSQGPKICAGEPPGYLTIKTGDFIKMVSIHPAASSDHAFSMASGDFGPPPLPQ